MIQTRIQIIEKNNGEFTYIPQIRYAYPFFINILANLFDSTSGDWFGLYEKEHEIVITELVSCSGFLTKWKAKELITKYLKQEELKKLQQIKKITYEKHP